MILTKTSEHADSSKKLIAFILIILLPELRQILLAVLHGTVIYYVWYLVEVVFYIKCSLQQFSFLCPAASSF